jgi:prepilin-type N-terminal cleavage/methylation domain-containing protein
MKEFFHRQDGLTLVEVLVSVTILSIVIFTFLSFFTTSAKFNAFSSDKINGTNIAREIHEDFKVNVNKNNDLRNLIKEAEGKTTVVYSTSTYPYLNATQDIQLDGAGMLHLEVNYSNYTVKAVIDTHPVLKTTTSLYKLQIQVYKQDKHVSETFAYLEF